MTIYYLMIKTHDITGLKYLCQTKRKTPHKYLGSGKYWRLHLEKHGHSHTTEILRECHSKEEVTEWGLHYSNLWNVVENDEWANLIPESGNGGNTGIPWNKNKVMNEKYRDRLREAVLKRTPETKAKMIQNGKDSFKKMMAVMTPEQHKERIAKGIGKFTHDERVALGKISGAQSGKYKGKGNATRGKVTVTDKSGHSKVISQEYFTAMKKAMLAQSIPITEWEVVQVSSNESRRRRTALLYTSPHV